MRRAAPTRPWQGLVAEGRRALGAARRRRGSHRASRAGRSRPTRSVLLLGLPLPLLVGGLVLAAVIGLLLAYALVLTTGGTGSATAGVMGGGNDAGSSTVVTEATLGPEVQDLIDTGYVESSADFDVARCLDQQGITDPVLILEEVSWGPRNERAWLVVHTAVDSATLQKDGGSVNVSVVLPTCGRGSARDASAQRLWTGSTILAPSSAS